MTVDPWLVKAFVVVQGNLIVRQRFNLDLAWFEIALGTGLRAGSATTLWFESDGRVRVPFEPWLEGLRAQGLRGIDLVPAVHGLAPTLLALDFGENGRRLYNDRWDRKKVALPSSRALLDFVGRHPGEGLEERVAHYAHQFSLIEESRWELVAPNCDPEENELWVQAFVLAQSHVDVTAQTAADWEALGARRASVTESVPALVFGMEPSPEAGELWPAKISAVSKARESLAQALRDNLALAQNGGWSNWVAWFTEALDHLLVPPASDDPWVRVNSGCGVPLEVPSLARAADKSHVFGGMGSWNDVPIDNHAQKERLWNAMHDAWGAVFAALHAHATAS